MKYVTEEDFMTLVDSLKIEFDKIGDRFNSMENKVDARFDVIEENFNRLFLQLNSHSLRLERIETNMVNKSQFKSLVRILERQEVITAFDAEHVLYEEGSK
jgi:hypothetical protein